MTNVKAKIEQKIDRLLDDMDGAAPTERVQYARAIQALASALSEVSGGAGNQGLKSIIDRALNQTGSKEGQDNQDDD